MKTLELFIGYDYKCWSQICEQRESNYYRPIDIGPAVIYDTGEVAFYDNGKFVKRIYPDGRIETSLWGY